MFATHLRKTKHDMLIHQTRIEKTAKTTSKSKKIKSNILQISKQHYILIKSKEIYIYIQKTLKTTYNLENHKKH